MTYLDQAQALFEELQANRRHLHQRPEIGFDLPQTVAFVKEKLTQYGLTPQDIGPSGVTALIGKPTGKTVLLRADMDALPIKEESGLDFAATSDFSHTCGHDMHTAILLATAKLLKDREDQLEGYVKLVFQPAEELLIGGKAMIEAGILQNPPVDVAFALHVAPNVPVKGLAYAPHLAMASASNFRLTIQGKGSHGATPHLGVDPVAIGAQMVTSLNQLISREIPFDQGAAITIGRFVADGAVNVIPDQVVLEGTARTFSEETRAYLRQRIPELCSAIAQAHRGEVTVEFLADCPVLINDPELAKTSSDHLRQVFGPNLPVFDIPAQHASEDFAYYANQVPAFFFYLCNPYEEKAADLFAVHHPKVVFGEDMMPIGASALAELAQNWLSQQVTNS